VRPSLVAVALVALLATRAEAQDAQDPERALSLAKDAFEYRDFPRVIATLDPWVHPPRIADRSKLAEAQRLLGISLHITGDIPRAELEFARVLEFDPVIRLDPFVVPPPVIETFERVRTSMRAVLDRILEERERDKRRPDPIAATKPVPAATLSPVFAYAPLGLSHFLTLEEPAWGALWLGLQAIGLATNIGAFYTAEGLRSPTNGLIPGADIDAYRSASGVAIAGLAFFGAAWLGSALHAHARWPAPADTTGYPPTPPTARGFTLRFD